VIPRAGRTRPTRLGPVLVRAGVVLLTAGALSACQLPDVSMSPPMSESTPAATPRATASPTATATPTADAAEVDAAAAEAAALEAAATPVRPPGELDVGSTTHVVPAGDRDLVVDWWTDQTAVDWTAGDPKTLQLSAHLEGGSDDEVLVLVTRFAAVLDDGVTRTQVDEDLGEFVISAPYTYGTVLTLPPSDSAATSLSVSLQFDLLVETEPGSERYFRQTVMDTLVLPLTTTAAEQETP